MFLKLYVIIINNISLKMWNENIFYIRNAMIENNYGNGIIVNDDKKGAFIKVGNLVAEMDKEYLLYLNLKN